MKPPSSQHYQFESLLSSNDLCQTWLAVASDTGQRCMVKRTYDGARCDLETARSILKETFNLQKQVLDRRVNRARRRRFEGGQLMLEHPWLDPGVWKPIVADGRAEDLLPILIDIAVVIDYLHGLGLVHGDLKLENFLVESGDGPIEVCLLDLDFLAQADTTPRDTVFGTPGHIAPEILANERVVIQSDNYSLGVSLREFIKNRQRTGSRRDEMSAETVESLSALAKALTAEDYLNRPRSLVQALHRHGLIDNEKHSDLQKRVLVMLLTTRYRAADRKELAKPGAVGRFIRERNNILGFQGGFTDLLGAAHIESPLKSFRVFRQLVGSSRVERHVDYWHVSADDSTLLSAYLALSEEELPAWAVEDTGRDLTDVELKAYLKYTNGLRERELFEFAYLFLRSLGLDRLRGLLISGVTAAADALETLRELARMLNRAVESEQCQQALIDAAGDDRERVVRLIPELIDDVMAGFELDRVQSLIDQNLPVVEGLGDEQLLMVYQRNQAWLWLSTGKYEQAEELLKRMLERATELRLPEYQVRVDYYLGVLNYRRGDYRLMENHLLKAYETAKRERLLSSFAGTMMALGQLYFAIGQYAKSIEFCKEALKNVTGRNRHSIPSAAGHVLLSAYVRLAEHQKAEYWLQQCLYHESMRFRTHTLLAYYLSESFVRVSQGDVMSARGSCYNALDTVDTSAPTKAQGKVCQNLVDVALQQGDINACSRWVEQSRSIMERFRDSGSLSEIRLLELLSGITGDNAARTEELSVTVRSLLDQRCFYYGARGILQLLLLTPEKHWGGIVELASPLRELMHQGGAPLFEVLRIMAGWHEGEGEDEGSVIQAWKRSFVVLLNKQARFEAMLVASHIARLYIEVSRPRHARKFLTQAIRLARSLYNRSMVSKLEQQLKSVSESGRDYQRLIESFHGVSAILRDIGDYRQSLRRLVEFAVEQTGAERGVLLMRSRQSMEFYVGASVNCDDQSLEDIEDFSTSLPRMAAEDLSPLIVENATSDKRTSKYKSIIHHNILSVFCVPLVDNDESIGALYLDHHTIPALFDEDDITYIVAIANFISVTLSTLQGYKSLSISNVQLLEDLNARGDRQAFITQDISMLRLFDSLPQIARSSTPVLILGESGTGKEILCHVIHDLSGRADMPLIKFNCAAVAETMVESELFGVSKNAATGVAEREGKFSAADGGTLYLDEIGDMALEVQAKVLRVLEYQQFERVGSNQPVYTDIRFLYATNKDLRALIAEGRFREDLYHRINTITIEIPPLRERRGDIPVLLEHFISIFSQKNQPPRLSSQVMERLIAYPWTGNVRELKNLVERLCILHPGEKVELALLPAEIRDYRGELADVVSVRAVEKVRIREALIAANWVQSHAAVALKMPLSTLRRRVKKLGISRS